MNFTALGEFTAYFEQAKDAADRRFAHLHNLGNTLIQASKKDQVLDFDDIANKLEEIRKTDAEMRAAVERANSAAALAQKTPLDLTRLCNK